MAWATERRVRSDEIRCALHRNDRCVAEGAVSDIYNALETFRRIFGPGQAGEMLEAQSLVRKALDELRNRDMRAVNRLVADMVGELGATYDFTGRSLSAFQADFNKRVQGALADITKDISFAHGIGSNRGHAQGAGEDLDALLTLLTRFVVEVRSVGAISSPDVSKAIEAKRDAPWLKEAVWEAVGSVCATCRENGTGSRTRRDAVLYSEAGRRFLRAAARLASELERCNGDEARKRGAIEDFLNSRYEMPEPVLRAFDIGKAVGEPWVRLVRDYTYMLNGHNDMLRGEINLLDEESTVTELLHVSLRRNLTWAKISGGESRSQLGAYASRTLDLMGLLDKNITGHDTIMRMRTLFKDELQYYITFTLCDGSIERIGQEFGRHALMLFTDKGKNGYDEEWLGLADDVMRGYRESVRGGRAIPPPPLFIA